MKKDFSQLAEARIKELITYVRTLNDSTQKVVLESLSKQLTDPVIKSQVRQIQHLAKATDGQVRQWLIETLPESYFEGFQFASKKAGGKRITYEVFLGSKDYAFHRNAINLLIKDGYGDFARTLTSTVRGAERMLSDAARQEIRGQIAAGEMEGKSAYNVGRTVRETLQDQGFKVMIDRAGRKWQLPDYSEMLARTHLIKTANEGVINRMSELGADIVEWSTGDNPCDLCDDLNGQIFSISGNSADYDPLTEQPPRHPNCRCSLLPRPELDSKE